MCQFVIKNNAKSNSQCTITKPCKLYSRALAGIWETLSAKVVLSQYALFDTDEPGRGWEII